MLNKFETMAKKASLKSWVQQQMFCPLCSSILDVRRAVEIEVNRTSGSFVEGQIVCAKCWEGPGLRLARFLERAKDSGYTVDINDGRELFKEDPEMQKPPPDLPDDVDEEDAPSMAQLEDWMMDGACEATDGCIVEPDGKCCHGHQSWLVKLGII